MDSDNSLIVRMFGGFTMIWNGRILTGGTKSDDTQLARLLQMLIHYRDTGVERSKLMRLLDEDSNADDVHHLLRSVLYNARKKLREVQLPESSYIDFRNGRYYWTKDISIIEDATEFEELCRRIDVETDPDKKKELCMEACYLYRGEFLPHQMRLMWVAEEQRHYNQLFRRCVETAADILREKRLYADLEALGRHATQVSPFNEWEALTMEALAALGRHYEAQELYKTTIEKYQKELGVRPSFNMINRLEEISIQFDHGTALPEDIREELVESEHSVGGYCCTYPCFRSIYRMLRRSSELCESGAFLMICTLDDYKLVDELRGAAIGSDTLSKVSDQILNVICSSVRRNEVVCRYAKNQFLIILVQRTEDECKAVRDRIDHSLSKVCGIKSGLVYDISPVSE